MAKKRKKTQAATPLSREEHDRVVRNISHAFMSAIPAAANSAGVHQFPEGGAEYPVEDGVYRVEGADWQFVFKGGRLLEAQRAGANSEPAIAVSSRG